MEKFAITCICGFVSVFIHKPKHAICAKCRRYLQPYPTVPHQQWWARQEAKLNHFGWEMGMSDDSKVTTDQRIDDLQALVKKLEDALEGIFNDFRRRRDDYHGVDFWDRY